MHHFVALCKIKLELWSGKAQIGANYFWPLWIRPLTWTFSMDITWQSMVFTPENFVMLRWEEPSKKGVADRQTDRRTDWRTGRNILWAAWSQLKLDYYGFIISNLLIWCVYVQVTDHTTGKACWNMILQENVDGIVKAAVTPLLTHWSYCSLALNHRYNFAFVWFTIEKRHDIQSCSMIVKCIVRYNTKQ